MNTEISVSVEAARLEDGAAAMSIKIQTEFFEINIWIQERDLHLLEEFNASANSWDARGSLPIGQCANAPVFWSKHSTAVSILIGHDDESWDIGVTLPYPIFRQILDEVRAARELRHGGA